MASVHIYIYISRSVLQQISDDLQTSTAKLTYESIDSVKFATGNYAGYGYFGSKKENFVEARKKAQRTLSYHRHHWFTATHQTPHVALSWPQPAELSKLKVRLIWCSAFNVPVIQLCQIQPIYR